MPSTPFSSHTVFKEKTLVEGILARIHDVNETFLLRLTRDGHVVDPDQAGITLHSGTWNRNVAPWKAGNEAFFFVSEWESYELMQHGNTLWSFGRRPHMVSGPTLAEEEERDRVYQAYIAWTHRALAEARALGCDLELPTGTIRASEHLPSATTAVGITIDPGIFIVHDF